MCTFWKGTTQMIAFVLYLCFWECSKSSRLISYNLHTLPVCLYIWDNISGKTYCKCNKRRNKNWNVNYAPQHWDMQSDSSLWHKVCCNRTPQFPMQVHITTNMCKLACIMLQTKPQHLRLNHSKKVKNHTLSFTNAETPKQLKSWHELWNVTEKWPQLQSLRCNGTKNF